VSPVTVSHAHGHTTVTDDSCCGRGYSVSE
jgi:hypothetical protein